MARFCSLFSSSSGNCTYLGSAGCGILIDAGVSAKKITAALRDRDIDPSAIAAVFVTHGHIDHIRGIKVFCSNNGIPVYATEGTLGELEMAGMLTNRFSVGVIESEGVEIRGMLVKPFETPHDCAESCGYTVELPDERTAAVATDIGHMTDEIMLSLLGRDLVMLESNHDVGMLQNGSYPYHLKRRILSPVGHLSNEACAVAAQQLIGKGTTRLFLGHLSAENNMPELAWHTTFAALHESGATIDRDYILQVNPVENTEDIVRF